jgi:hypothetical protein
MDSFEQVVASILERKGYWTRTALKVALEPEDKHAIDRPSSPRCELDVVGYSGRDNHLVILECKSFLDSPGVRSGTFAGNNPKDEKRYKLFFEDTLRKVVLKRLVKQLVHHGFCAPRPRVTFGLAAGRIHGDAAWLQRYFKTKRWQLWTPDFIAKELRSFRHSKYENSVAWVVAKLILAGTADDETMAT